jgi:hypothetical protein
MPTLSSLIGRFVNGANDQYLSFLIMRRHGGVDRPAAMGSWGCGLTLTDRPDPVNGNTFLNNT